MNIFNKSYLGILFLSLSFSAAADSQTINKLRSVFDAGNEPSKKTLKLPSVWKCIAFADLKMQSQVMALHLEDFGDFVENKDRDLDSPRHGRSPQIVSGIKMLLNDPVREVLMGDAKVMWGYHSEDITEGTVYFRETKQGNLVGEATTSFLSRYDSLIEKKYNAAAYLYCAPVRSGSGYPRRAAESDSISDVDATEILDALETEI